MSDAVHLSPEASVTTHPSLNLLLLCAIKRIFICELQKKFLEDRAAGHKKHN